MRKLSEIVNLEKAYRQVLNDEQHSQDLIPDIIYFIDSKNIKARMLDELRKKMDSNQFKVGDLFRMDVPKGNYFIRPAARPHLVDWIVYQALANYVGAKADKKTSSNVYSSRFNRRTSELLHWREQWLKFERAFWANFDGGYRHVFKTDITAYFCNISLEKLRSAIIGMLDTSDESDKVLELLFNGVLRPWTEKQRNAGFGLPQGIITSSILANLFLARVDARLSRNRRIRYLRYADDMRVLAKDLTEAKIALKELSGELRSIGLDLNERKTQILSGSEVERELRDPQQLTIAGVQTILGSGDDRLIREIAIPMLGDLFERSFDSTNPFGGRHLKFSVNCLVRLREIYKDLPDQVEVIGVKLLDQLEYMPSFADVFSRFFGAFPRTSFKKKLLRFLKKPSNIYEWQEMHILDSLLRFDSFNSNDLRLFRDIAFSGDKHVLCRAKAVLLLGKFGDENERYELMARFHDESDYCIRRAIVIGTWELSIAERNSFYTTVKRTDQDQAALIDYVKSTQEPVYFDPFIPSPVSIIEEPY